MVVDLEHPLPDIDGRGGQTAPSGAVWMLVRLHARPLGDLTLSPDELPMSAASLSERIHQAWGRAIEEHLRSDDADGTESSNDPWQSCVLHQPSYLPSVSVVVPTYQRPDEVVRCVGSIVATGYPHLEVLVVDNAPAHRLTAQAVEESYGGDERVHYLAEWTAGASRARNLGVRHATGEIVAFADDDVVVDPHWIAALVHAFAGHPDVSCVTGLVIPKTLETPVQAWFEDFGGFNRGYAQREFDLSEHRGDSLLYPYTAGAMGGLGNSAFRRSALLSPDAFNTVLGPGTPAFGAEDQDAFVSLLKRGERLLYEPAALVHHTHRDSYGELRWQVFTYGAGMAAALVHWAVSERAVAVELSHRVIASLPLIVRGGNRDGSLPSASASCPPVLRTLERLGYVYGPVAYARAVLRHRQIEKAAARKDPERLVDPVG